MSLVSEARLSDSPYIESVMRGWTLSEGTTIRPAEIHWHMVFVSHPGGTMVGHGTFKQASQKLHTYAIDKLDPFRALADYQLACVKRQIVTSRPPGLSGLVVLPNSPLAANINRRHLFRLPVKKRIAVLERHIAQYGLEQTCDGFNIALSLVHEWLASASESK